MKTNFHTKLFFYISALMILLMSVCVVTFSLYTYKNMKSQSETNLNQLNKRITTELQTLFDDMDKLALYVSTNPSIMQAFMEAKSPNYSNSILSRKIIRIITSISIPNSSSRFRISLYNDNGNFISTGIPHTKSVVEEKTTSEDYSTWYYSLPVIVNNYSISGFHPDYWSNSDMLYISLYREIFDSYLVTATTGIIDVQCPYSIIQDILSFQTDEYGCYLFNDTGNIVFPLPETSVLPEESNQIYAENSLNNHWRLVTAQSNKHILKVLLPQILSIIFMGCAALMIFLVMMFIITKRATQPLRDLTSAVKGVSLSNLSLEADTYPYSDEITRLNRAFENMFERLKQSMDEIVRMQAYEMQANMVALQSQMNPHFLYNILTIIKAYCRENNTGQIAITCDYMVKMLRYISDYDTSFVPLCQELDHAEYYLKLMKIRYEEQFTYSFYVDSDINVETLHIPKLAIQSLVENCFQHGFKEVAPPWTISIRCWGKDNQWFLSVEDNGSGITALVLEDLNHKIEEFLTNPSDALTSLRINGMGLINTVARLKLKYKEQFTFIIKNLPSEGTLVTLGGVFEDEYFTG